jgi:PAS domain S-box-containing protein
VRTSGGGSTGPRKGAARAGGAGKAARKRGTNDAFAPDQSRAVHELELHQLELETQNRALREWHHALEESRARYADIYDHSPVGHLTLDAGGFVRELNLATAALLEKERRVVVDRPLRVFVTPESRDRLDVHLRAVRAAQRPTTVELSVVRADRSLRTVEVISAPPPEAGVAGQAEGTFYSAMIDVSARRSDVQLRDEILKTEHEARVQAERLNHVKQEFLSLVSHELRSPLSPMRMWVRALRAGGAADTLRQRAVDALDTCITVQAAMIDDLIDVARGQLGTLRVERRPVDLRSVVSAAVETFAPLAAAKHILLGLRVDPGPLVVSGDETRLRQILTNLLSNAISFTGEAGEVTVTLRRRGDQVELEIHDDGRGMDERQLARIFEPLEVGDGPLSMTRGGLGLGLAVVRHLVERHDGKVVAESLGAGRGSRFVVTLPIPSRPEPNAAN